MRVRPVLICIATAAVVAGSALLLRTQPPSVAAQAKADTPRTTHAGHVTIAISNYAFAPKKLTVVAGTRITWVNHDATAHTATSDQSRFDTGSIGPHGRKTIDFRRAGTYTYHCAFHAFMTATVTVKR